jgi:hypothetical protein
MGRKPNYDEPNQKHGAFVEEARKLMEEENESKQQRPDEGAAGGGVKIVRKLGKKT